MYRQFKKCHFSVLSLAAVCTDNIVECGEDSCTCEAGYLPPDCCECDLNGEVDGTVYYRDGDQCLRKFRSINS